MISIKPNFKSQLRNWSDFIQQIIILLPFYLYSYYQNGDSVLIVYYVFILIQLLPTIYLTIMYFVENRGEEFIISENKIVKIDNGISKSYDNFEIKKVVICKSATKDKGGIPFSTFETFRLARVYLKDGSNFIMTNSLEYDIEKPISILKGIVIERRKGFSFFI